MKGDTNWNISDMHEDGHTGFHRACWGNEQRHTQTVKKFVELGVNPNEPNSKG